jgi:hypothetical protein
MKVTTCHNYKIQYKYIYRCENYNDGSKDSGGTCTWEMGRHSKSVDIMNKVCGRCRGKINTTLILSIKYGITLNKCKKPTKYQLFKKKQFQLMKKTNLTLGEKNKEIARLWSIEKQ